MCINNNPKKAFIVLIGMLSAFYSYSQVWSDVGGGTNNSPVYFGEYNNKLIVTGGDTFGIKPIYAVASWDGIQWDSLGSANPTNGVPYCYAEFNNELYAGGGFQYMQGLVNTYHIARWDGSQWLSAGSTYNDVGWINVLAVYNNQLYAAGNITKIGGVNVNRIAKWNGTNWSSVGGGVTGGFALINCMAVYNNQLYVGGDFSYAGGILSQYIARWNGTQWDSVGSALGALNSEPFTMVVDSVSNVLYVGGSFTTAGGAPAKYVAKWNGSNWSSVGTTITNGAIAMEMYHNELYVGCGSTNGSVTDTIIARWDGSNWYQVVGPNNTVSVLKVYKDYLYIGGYFTQVGSTAANYIAKWFSPDVTSVEEKKNDIQYLGNTIPNPFSNTTSIPYFIPKGSKGILTVNDMQGGLIKTITLIEGSSKLEISLADFSSGVYFYTLDIDDGRIIRHKKMILNK